MASTMLGHVCSLKLATAEDYMSPSTAFRGVLPTSLQRHWYNDASYSAEDPWRAFDPKRTALILVDLINWQVDPEGVSICSIREAGLDESADYLTNRCSGTILPNLLKILNAAREVGVQVIHTRLASRHPDYLDIVPALRSYVRAAEAQDGSWACQPLEGIWDECYDLSIVKTGSGAFTGSGLDMLLRRLNINTLLYAGVVTNACVMLTATAGFDLGYRQYLISDCTGALSEQDQADTERLIGLYIAEPVSSEQTLTALGDKLC